jgi:protein-disulfide isomerase
MKKSLPFIIIGVVLLLAVGTTWALLKRSRSDTNPLTQTGGAPASVSGGTATNPAPEQSSNSAGLSKPNVKVSSPVILEEYGDYQCPPCGQLYPELKRLEHEYGNQLRVVFRHFPLTSIHKNAMAAAHAAEAARNQGKFWEMHDLLYQNQAEWAESADAKTIFVGYARRLSLNVDQFNSDVGSNQINQRITADVQRGASVRVTGTPTVFLDGNLLRYEATTPEGLRRAINILLEQKAGS